MANTFIQPVPHSGAEIEGLRFLEEVRRKINSLLGMTSTPSLDIFGTSIQLTLGTNITEFSTDGTLAGNSDDAVPTEKAVKTYIDANDFWTRTGTTLSPKTSGDDLSIDGTVSAEGLTVQNNAVNLDIVFEQTGFPAVGALSLALKNYNGDYKHSIDATGRYELFSGANVLMDITSSASHHYMRWNASRVEFNVGDVDLDFRINGTTGTAYEYTAGDGKHTLVGGLLADAFSYLDADTGGSSNLAIGENSGNFGLMTGGFNTLIGKDVGMSLTSGASNVGVGVNAIPALNTGSNNVGLGTNALLQCNSGSGNFALGSNTLRGVTSAVNNVAIGNSACRFTAANANIGIGAGAMYTNVTGANNIAIGADTMNIGSAPTLNIAIGNTALKDNNSSQNVAIGYNTGRTVTGASNVLLGYNTASTQTTISNQLWVANSSTVRPLLLGDFSAEWLKIHGDLHIPSDTDLLKLGAGDDVSIGYDGTVATIDTGVVAPSDLDIDCGTEKTLRLVQGVYDDLPPSLFSNSRIPLANAPAWQAFISGGVNYLYNFNTGDYVFATPIEVTHKYKEGTDLTIHIHWATGQGSDVDDRGVKWEVTYTCADANAAFPAETVVSAEATIAAGTAANTHQITGIGTISGTGMTIGAYIIATVKRIAATGTAPSNDPYGIALGVHVEEDTMGSRQLFTK